jgi:predicted nucleic acid-binding protein
MSEALMRCVVDASVGIKLFVSEPDSERAIALFARLATEPRAELYVPDLFFIECANILWKQTRRSGFLPVDVRHAIRQLGKLALRSVPASQLMEAALAIAITQSITAYDACYVALAYQLGIPFVTADERLVRLLSSTPYTLRWLHDLPDV